MSFRSWDRNKPPVGYGIDWGDPITENMTFRLLMNESGGAHVNDIVIPKKYAFQNAVTWTDTILGKALQFLAAGSRSVVLGNLSALAFEYNAPFTVSFWASVTATGVQYFFISQQDNTAPNAGWAILVNTANDVRFIGRNTATTNEIVTATSSTPFATTNVVKHVVVTYSGSATAAGVSIYINGISQALTATVDTASASWATSKSGSIGSRENTSQYLSGTVSNVAAWKRRLSASEVLRLYTEPFAGIVTPRRRFASVAAAGVTGSPYYAYNQMMAG